MIDNCKGLAHIGFFVTDMERSQRFYEDTFGFRTFFESTQENGKVQIAFLQLNELTFEMISVEGLSFPADGCFQHLAIRVENIEEAVKKLDKLGVAHEEIVYAPNMLKNGAKWCNFKGPDGEHLEFNEVL